MFGLYIPWAALWLVIFLLFRYVRVAMNLHLASRYKPTPLSSKPKFDGSNLTVVQCTRASDIMAPGFLDSVQSILAHNIAQLFICTGGNMDPAIAVSFLRHFDDNRIRIFPYPESNRRRQTALAVPNIKTELMMILDDHTPFIDDQLFIPTLLAPFDNPEVGGVVPLIVVRNFNHFRKGQRTWTDFCRGFWNVLACLYLERWYLEYKATTTFEGSISCMSSRCNVVRSSIFCDPEFQEHYLNEYIKHLIPTVTWRGLVWGETGPLNPSDDACLTRWLACKGYHVKVQAGPETTLVTEMGVYKKYREQCDRWNRSKFQSCPNVLWYQLKGHLKFPYLIYTDGIYPYFRTSLIYEAVMLYLTHAAMKDAGYGQWFWSLGFPLMMAFITVMKFVKILGHFKRHGWSDLLYFPGYILFAWANTPYKFYWMATRTNVDWGTAEG